MSAEHIIRSFLFEVSKHIDHTARREIIWVEPDTAEEEALAAISPTVPSYKKHIFVSWANSPTGLLEKPKPLTGAPQ